MNEQAQPKYNQDRLVNKIVSEQYYHFPGTTAVVCCLQLDNEYNAIGESTCADARKFDLEIGRRLAYEAALRRIRGHDTYHRMEMRAAVNRITHHS